MTAPSSWITFRPTRTLHLEAPHLRPSDVSIVIPVRNNPSGLARLLDSISGMRNMPKEVIVVDNMSSPAVTLPSTQFPTTLIHCHKLGPAAARNAGVSSASGAWVWFLDSDCIVAQNSLDQFAKASGGVIGMCGAVKSQSNRLLGRYYESQEILLPQFADNDEPLYLITASACIHRTTFLDLGGFDESFPLAAGEDIDLGFRLFQAGRLAFVPNAVVHHEFEEDLDAFVKRFQRYGRGNKLLANKYGISLSPSPFVPNNPTFFKLTLAKIQYEALLAGYSQTHPLYPADQKPA